MADVYLDVVDQNDQVIGREQRSVIHAQGVGRGLWHREIHVWFITPNNRIIFQKRGPEKEIHPNLLGATVGGHVELGQSYAEAALMEVQEETGLHLTMANLVPLVKLRVETFDEVTGRCNYCFRQIYGHVFKGNIADLAVEAGQAAGFETIDYAELVQLDPSLVARICPGHTKPDYMAIYKQLVGLI
jgi:8-oxo-dGTP pyrophosphatase MutT (NUDIX family)